MRQDVGIAARAKAAGVTMGGDKKKTTIFNMLFIQSMIYYLLLISTIGVMYVWYRAVRYDFRGY